jgi:predicted PurR-regulated permease PerM
MAISAARLSMVQRIKQQHKAAAAEEVRVEQFRPHDLRSIRRAVMVIAILAVGAVVWAAESILVPTALGVVVALILTPMVSALEKLRIPTSIASVLVVIMAVALIASAVAVLRPGVARWIDNAPQIARTIEQKIQPVRSWLASLEAASSRFEKLTNTGNTPAVVTRTDEGGSIIETAPAALAQTFYVIALALFIMNVRKVYRKRLILLSRDRADRLRVARIMNESFEQVSEYLFTMMCVGIGVGVATAIAFAIAGIDSPLIWGLAFGVGSLIPYIGPTSVILICALAQFATQPTLADAAVAPLLLLAINTIEANFVTPLLVSRRTAVSAIAIFLTIALFVWLWGPAASIVAVPMLILFAAIAKHVPALQPYAVLLQAENGNTSEIGNPARHQFFAEIEGNENEQPKTWFDVVRTAVSGRHGNAA